MKIYLSVCLALAVVHVALGRAQSPTNGGIPVQQVSTGETMLPNNHSQHQVDRAVAMVKTEIEKTFLPLIPLLVTSLFENNSSDVADIKTQQQIEKFENGFATAFGLNNTVNSTIQMENGVSNWIAKQIANVLIPIVIDALRKYCDPSKIVEFEIGVATAFGVNNTVNSTIQTSRLGFDWKLIAKKIAEILIPILLDEVKKHWMPKNENGLHQV